MPAVRGTCAKCADALGDTDHTGWSLPDENKNANSQVLIKRQQPSAPAVLRCTQAILQHSYTKLHSRSFSYEYSSTRTADAERMLVDRVAWLTAADGVQGADAAANSALVVDDDDEAATGQVAANATAPTATAVYAATGPFVYSYSSSGACLAAWRLTNCLKEGSMYCDTAAVSYLVL